MKKLSLLIALTATLLAAGCANQSPSRVAYNVTGTAITSAENAMAAWRDYVNNEKAVIASLKETDPGLALDKANKLLIREGEVSAAYDKYQKAMIAVVQTGAAASDNYETISAQIAAISAPLVSLIVSFTSK